MVLILKSNNPVCNFWNNCPYFAFLANVDKNYNLSKDLTFSIELALNLSTTKSDTLKTKQEVLSHMAFFFQNFHYDINMYIYLRLFDIILTYNSIKKILSSVLTFIVITDKKLFFFTSFRTFFKYISMEFIFNSVHV